MLKRIISFFPCMIRQWGKFAVSVIKKELPYIEVHLTDHCNLNCKGCLHYSSIAHPVFTDLSCFQKDIQRLSQLFRSVTMLRLMGGEPFLHPEAPEFIRASRLSFPKTDIRFATNGLLLPKASDEFWEVCRTTQTVIDWTVYPPLKQCAETYQALCMSHGVRLSMRSADQFSACSNLKGNSDPRQQFKLCHIGASCRFLQNGRLYTCAMPALVHYFNDRFGYSIAADPGIDIYSDDWSGRRLLIALNRPIKTCQWCTNKELKYPWRASIHAVPEDWDAAFQKRLRETEGTV